MHAPYMMCALNAVALISRLSAATLLILILLRSVRLGLKLTPRVLHCRCGRARSRRCGRLRQRQVPGRAARSAVEHRGRALQTEGARQQWGRCRHVPTRCPPGALPFHHTAHSVRWLLTPSNARSRRTDTGRKARGGAGLHTAGGIGGAISRRRQPAGSRHGDDAPGGSGALPARQALFTTHGERHPALRRHSPSEPILSPVCAQRPTSISTSRRSQLQFSILLDCPLPCRQGPTPGRCTDV